MDQLGLTHLVFAIVALAAGTLVVLARKGTRFHRSVGHLYLTSMLAVNVTALLIYDLSGTFNFFHLSALFSLVCLVIGMGPVLTRRPRQHWLELHAHFVSGSYVGLVAAAAAEATSRIPGVEFGLAVGLTTLAVVAAGVVLIQLRAPRAIARFQRRRTSNFE
jgi:uncharacterized membrane protein